MPKSKKPTRKSGTKSLLPNGPAKKPGFKPEQSRMPQGLKPGRAAGGKPKLFPGRTGGR